MHARTHANFYLIHHHHHPCHLEMTSRRLSTHRRRESEDTNAAPTEQTTSSGCSGGGGGHHSLEKGKLDKPSVAGASSSFAWIDSSMYNLLANAPDYRETYAYNLSKYSLKPLIIQGINELIDELENARSNIAAQALDHIQN